jgi:hypothetical protein
MKRTIPFLILVAVAWGVGFHCARHSTICHTTDTLILTRVETLRIDRPVERVRTIVRHDTVWLPTIDTTRSDSARVTLPITQTVYSDNLNYRATISGYRARLDTLVFLNRERQTTITRNTKPRFTFSAGVQAGYYLTPRGWQLGVGVGIGAGITINFGQTTKQRRRLSE